MSEALKQVAEKSLSKEDKGFSSQQIKQAYGILNDPRYKQGNYSGAYAAIEKIAKGLAKHPDVANALKRANEELEEDSNQPYVIVDIKTGKKLKPVGRKKKVVKKIQVWKEIEEKPKTRWQKIMDWLNTPIGGY